MSEFKAFISCSLRSQDARFVTFIERYLHQNGIEPFGTVGRNAASPQNPVELMKENIEKSDFIVVCATKRYFQEDIHNKNQKSAGISEMLQFESGMAHASSKPLIVFVEEGVNMGSAIPNITQYITVRKNGDRLAFQRKTAFGLLEKVKEQCEENRSMEMFSGLGVLAVIGLAIYGGAKLLTGRI